MGSGAATGRASAPRQQPLRAPVSALDSDIRLTLPARPENVAVVRHVLGALADALGAAARA